jgi:hypothetical protein
MGQFFPNPRPHPNGLNPSHSPSWASSQGLEKNNFRMQKLVLWFGQWFLVDYLIKLATR